MKNHLLSISLLLALAFSACNQADNQHDHATATHNEATHEGEHPQKAANGKWLINAEMKAPLQKSETLITNYIDASRTDYLDLAVGLKSENEALIKSCTMEGESHDALHGWLYPHMDLIKALAAATEQAKADSLIQSLQASFATFHEQFE